jgi:hypothetical protein
MRSGYLLMGVGLALVEWRLLPDAHTMPLYKGVTVCWLTAMSLFAFLGLRCPVTLPPLLLLETTWKLLWLAQIALPEAVEDNVDAATADTVFSCFLVIVIIAVIPWGHVWRTCARANGDRWR